MRAMEYLQLDPLNIIARSQDITLHSRVLDYTPGMWEDLAYQQRKFFDWGGWLAVRPMDELPHWCLIMRRERDGDSGDPRIARMARDHADAINEMRAILRERGTVSNRDFEMASRTRTQSYRGRKDSALALYYLWRIGEVMTHHREHLERVYALTETVAPAHLMRESDQAEAERFLIRKEVSFFGLAPLRRTADAFHGRGEPDRAAKKLLGAMVADGDLIEVQVEGWKAVHYALGSDAFVLADVSAGRVPKSWTPRDSTTTEEVVFLAPLDHVCARGRAKVLFGFDYVWEVYKPLPQRRFGYYTLPMLWGDRLVARFDSKLDRTTNTLDWQTIQQYTRLSGANGLRVAAPGSTFAEYLGTSRQTGYATLKRWVKEGVKGLDDKSRAKPRAQGGDAGNRQRDPQKAGKSTHWGMAHACRSACRGHQRVPAHVWSRHGEAACPLWVG